MKFVDEDGRVWPSKKAFNQFKINMRLARKLDLEFEDYTDDTDDHSIDEDEAFKKLYNIRRNFDAISTDQLIKDYNFIVKRFYEIIDELGRENFIFYDDGTVNYIWRFKGKSKK